MEWFARRALLFNGWARGLGLSVAADGILQLMSGDASSGSAERLAGPLLPGMPNLHSHAYQWPRICTWKR